MRDRIADARNFAILAHTGQFRKYDGTPYVTHCERVAGMVSQVVGRSEDMICAAWLHDTVEDTDTTVDDIYNAFGSDVAWYVWYLTDIDKIDPAYSVLNRAKRKSAQRKRLSKAPWQVQSIKCCDLIDNTSDITANDRNFAKVYLVEKTDLLTGLTKADFDTYSRAVDALREALLDLHMGHPGE